MATLAAKQRLDFASAWAGLCSLLPFCSPPKHRRTEAGALEKSREPFPETPP